MNDQKARKVTIYVQWQAQAANDKSQTGAIRNMPGLSSRVQAQSASQEWTSLRTREFKVDQGKLLEASKLFRKKFTESQTSLMNYGLRFTVKHQAGLNQFFEYCEGKEVEVLASDVIKVLEVANEWECDSVFERICMSKDIDTGILAANFDRLAVLPSFANISSTRIMEIFQREERQMPSPCDYCKFVVRAIEMHGMPCLALVEKVDLLRSDLDDLLALQEKLQELDMELLCPDLEKVIDLKQKAKQYDDLSKKT